MNVDVTTEVEKDIPSMVSGFLNRATSNFKSSKSMIWRNWSTHDYSIYGSQNCSWVLQIIQNIEIQDFWVPILGNLHIYYSMFLLQLQDTARYKPKNDETTSKKWWWSDLALKRSQPFSWSAVATATNQPWNDLSFASGFPSLGWWRIYVLLIIEVIMIKVTKILQTIIISHHCHDDHKNDIKYMPISVSTIVI